MKKKILIIFVFNQYLKYKITFLKYILFIFFLEQKSISAKYESQNFCYSIYKIIKTVHFLSAKIYAILYIGILLIIKIVILYLNLIYIIFLAIYYKFF